MTVAGTTAAAVSPAGAPRMAGRGPRRTAVIPSCFIRRRAAAAVARAPSDLWVADFDT